MLQKTVKALPQHPDLKSYRPTHPLPMRRPQCGHECSRENQMDITQAGICARRDPRSCWVLRNSRKKVRKKRRKKFKKLS